MSDAFIEVCQHGRVHAGNVSQDHTSVEVVKVVCDNRFHGTDLYHTTLELLDDGSSSVVSEFTADPHDVLTSLTEDRALARFDIHHVSRCSSPCPHPTIDDWAKARNKMTKVGR